MGKIPLSTGYFSRSTVQLRQVVVEVAEVIFGHEIERYVVRFGTTPVGQHDVLFFGQVLHHPDEMLVEQYPKLEQFVGVVGLVVGGPHPGRVEYVGQREAPMRTPASY